MSQFKIGDIVRLKDSNDKDYFYKIIICSNFILGDDNSEKILKCEVLGSTRFTFFMESTIQKVTFYEMLDYIKDRYMRLTINKPNWDILNCLIDFTNSVTKDISYAYDASDDNVTFYYYANLNSNNLYVDFDNLDFEKDYMEYTINKELDKCVDILKDTFVNYLIYGENTTKDEFLKKALEKETPKVELKPFVPEISSYSNWKSNYINIFNMDKEPKYVIVAGTRGTGKTKTLKEMCEDNMTREQVQNTINNLFKRVNKKEPEDTVFINNKNKTTVIKWKDGTMTKATCEKSDTFDLEKGVMVAMLKKYYTVDEINSFIDKAVESQERDMHKWRKKEHKKVYPKTSKKVKE